MNGDDGRGVGADHLHVRGAGVGRPTRLEVIGQPAREVQAFRLRHQRFPLHSGQEQQGFHEPLQPPRFAMGDREYLPVFLGRSLPAQSDLKLTQEAGERGAELVRGLSRERRLPLVGQLHPPEQVVEGRGQFPEFVRRRRHGQPDAEVRGRDGGRRPRHRPHRPQRAPTQPPAQQRREQQDRHRYSRERQGEPREQSVRRIDPDGGGERQLRVERRRGERLEEARGANRQLADAPRLPGGIPVLEGAVAVGSRVRRRFPPVVGRTAVFEWPVAPDHPSDRRGRVTDDQHCPRVRFPLDSALVHLGCGGERVQGGGQLLVDGFVQVCAGEQEERDRERAQHGGQGGQEDQQEAAGEGHSASVANR